MNLPLVLTSQIVKLCYSYSQRLQKKDYTETKLRMSQSTIAGQSYLGLVTNDYAG